MQWNARSAVSNKMSLLAFLNQNHIDICIISETWFKPGLLYNFQGYSVIRKDRVDGKAGVAVLVHNSIPFKESELVNNFSNGILACGVQIT